MAVLASETEGAMEVETEAAEKMRAAPAAPAPAPPPATGIRNKSLDALIRLLNKQRLLYGMSTLKVNPLLMVCAQKHADNMASQAKMQHTLDNLSPFDRMNRAGYLFKLAAENLARGQRTPHATLKTWMTSRGHRQNLLNPAFKDVGLGLARDGKGLLYWVVTFGAQSEKSGLKTAMNSTEGKSLPVWRMDKEEERPAAMPAVTPVAMVMASPVAAAAAGMDRVAPPRKKFSPLTPALRSRALGVLFSMTNDTREGHGLTPFTENQAMNIVAQALADQMAHRRMAAKWEAVAGVKGMLEKLGYRAAIDARNTALNQPSPAAALEFWLGIKQQRENLMKPEHVDTGQGLSRDEAGRLFWVQLYAAPNIHR